MKINTEKLNFIENSIITLMKGEINEIIKNTRKNMIVVEEKVDGDSATIADIEIGKLLENKLKELLPNSIVIQEESFDENVYKNLSGFEYIWVVDPIDGTKAFRDLKNYEWCVGCCLFEDLMPVFSAAYVPEPWLNNEPLLLTAQEERKEVFNFGEPFVLKTQNKLPVYISHIHTDMVRNDFENSIAEIFPENEIMRAYVGHSTLAQVLSLIVNQEKVFSRRKANIWDVVQSAYIIQKCGFEVYYEDGTNIFPLNLEKLEFNNNHFYMPFIIASSKDNKKEIMKKLQK